MMLKEAHKETKKQKKKKKRDENSVHYDWLWFFNTQFTVTFSGCEFSLSPDVRIKDPQYLLIWDLTMIDMATEGYLALVMINLNNASSRSVGLFDQHTLKHY